MGCEDNRDIASTSYQPRWLREQAVDNMARQGCVEELRSLALTSYQDDFVKERCMYALDALAKITQLTISGSTVNIRIAETEITIDTVAVKINSLEKESADALYQIATISFHEDWIRKMAMQTLVDIGSPYCRKIATTGYYDDWLREMAMGGV